MDTLAALELAICHGEHGLAIVIRPRVAGRESGHLGTLWSRPRDGRVDCVRPGGGECYHFPPAGRTRFLGAGEGPPLLGLIANVGPRPLEEAGGPLLEVP